ncbi:oligosaccharide flippase family protein [Providencia sp. PROV144]|uniref:oligosaccharide flippase family protein n=1 Tax=Providencia sp. PROV144 TaxID=2949854 RepID=UPI00234A5FFB|nr:oligosaccharide flippase family protein [Providencia sp. PROV144]
MSKNKKILRNIFFLVLIQLLNYLAPLLALPYLSRVLSVDNFGLIMVLISFLVLIKIITDFGFNISATHKISCSRENKKFISRYLGSIFSLKLILIGISLVICYLYFFAFNKIPIKDKETLYFYFTLTVIFQAYQPIWFFQGIEKMQNITAVMSASKISYLIFIFSLVKTDSDINNVILCLMLSNFIASAACFIAIYKSGYYIKTPTLKFIYITFRKNIYFFFSRAAVSIYTTVNTFLIGSYAGLYQAALYSSAEKLYQAGQSISLPVSQALFPHLSKNKDITTLYKFVLVMLIPLTLICIVSFILAPNILALFYGDKYIAGENILRVFLISIVVSFININFGYPAFSTLNKLNIANLTVLIGGAVQLLAIVILIVSNNFSALNIAISTLLSETLVMILRISLFAYYNKRDHVK